MREVIYVRGSEDREDEPGTGEKRGFKRKAEEEKISTRDMDKFLGGSPSSALEVDMGEEKDLGREDLGRGYRWTSSIKACPDAGRGKPRSQITRGGVKQYAEK